VSRFTLDPVALRSNLALAREWAPAGARVRAMVKANAYGHGLQELIETFAEHADELGVATLEEGMDLRSWLSRDMPIFLVSGAKEWGSRKFFDAVREARLIPAVSSVDELRLFADRVKGTDPVQVELKFDTGMGRLGIQERDLPDVISLLQSFDTIRVVGLMTHFASSDEEDLAPTREQEACFRRVVAKLPENLVQGASIHSCNSGALMQRCLGQTDIAQGTTVVRPGVMLYGAGPSRYLHDTSAGDRLTEVGKWTTRVIEVRTIKPGGAVGYGGTWRAERPSRIAVLPVGYGDGYLRGSQPGAVALARGRRVPLVGRVSMDAVTVDVTDLPGLDYAEEFVLLGRQGSASVTAGELARRRNTIAWEALTSMAQRVGRVYYPQAGTSQSE